MLSPVSQFFAMWEQLTGEELVHLITNKFLTEDQRSLQSSLDRHTFSVEKDHIFITSSLIFYILTVHMLGLMRESSLIFCRAIKKIPKDTDFYSTTFNLRLCTHKHLSCLCIFNFFLIHFLEFKKCPGPGGTKKPGKHGECCSHTDMSP